MESFLTGKNILLTRPLRQAEESRPLFESAGAEIFIQPAFKILPAEDLPLKEISPAQLASYNRIIFSSGNGVLFFLDAIRNADQKDGSHKRFDILHKIPLAAVGPGTAAELERNTLSADLVPSLHSAEGLLESLQEEGKKGAHFLSIRGDRGRSVLKEGLTKLGGSFQEISVYKTAEIAKPDPEIFQRLVLGRIDFTIITSSATGAGIVRLFGDKLKKTKLISISPLTTSALVKLGFPPELESGEASIPGIIAALKDYLTSAAR